jgi:hypothetical protein
VSQPFGRESRLLHPACRPETFNYLIPVSCLMSIRDSSSPARKRIRVYPRMSRMTTARSDGQPGSAPNVEQRRPYQRAARNPIVHRQSRACVRLHGEREQRLATMGAPRDPHILHRPRRSAVIAACARKGHEGRTDATERAKRGRGATGSASARGASTPASCSSSEPWAAACFHAIPLALIWRF